MKENSIKPYCYCGESESSLVDNAIFVYFGDFIQKSTSG